jgi:hypothetical protein
MWPDRWRAVAVVVLAVTAGCNAFGPTPDVGADAPAATVTPVPVDSPTPNASARSTTLAPRALPPGVSQNGSVAVDSLAFAHRDAVADRSYTLRIRYNVTTLDSQRDALEVRVNSTARDAHARSFERYDRTIRVANETRYLDVKDSTDQTRRTFVDSDGTHVRVERPNQTVGYRHANTPVEAGYFTFLVTDWLRTHLSLSSAQVTSVDRGGERLYRLYTTEPPRGLRAADQSVGNVSVTAYVAPTGLVRGFYAEYDQHVDGVHRRVRLRVTYRTVGETTVTEPDWVRDRTSGNATPG